MIIFMRRKVLILLLNRQMKKFIFNIHTMTQQFGSLIIKMKM